MQMQKIHFFGKRFGISLKFNYAAKVLITVITLPSMCLGFCDMKASDVSIFK
jgi:hypothetical protein